MLKKFKEDALQAYKWSFPFIILGVALGLLGELFWSPLILIGIASIAIGSIILWFHGLG